VDNEGLRYRELNDFDRAMVGLLNERQVLREKAQSRWIHQEDKVIIFNRGELLFSFNFHWQRSFENYFIPVGSQGRYEVCLSSDDGVFGGYGRVEKNYIYEAKQTPEGLGFYCYLPSRTAVVLQKLP